MQCATLFPRHIFVCNLLTLFPRHIFVCNLLTYVNNLTKVERKDGRTDGRTDATLYTHTPDHMCLPIEDLHGIQTRTRVGLSVILFSLSLFPSYLGVVVVVVLVVFVVTLCASCDVVYCKRS